MNDQIVSPAEKRRFSRTSRFVWLAVWGVAGLLLFVASMDIGKTYFMMTPIWLALAPGVLPRFSFISLGILGGYTVMLALACFSNAGFNFDGFRRDEYFTLLVLGAGGGFVITVSRCGLRPDSPIDERILRTALMTFALIALVAWSILPDVR